MATQVLQFRATTRELEILEGWCKSHPTEDGAPAPLSDALRAAVEGLRQMEARRTSRRTYEAKRRRISTTRQPEESQRFHHVADRRYTTEEEQQ